MLYSFGHGKMRVPEAVDVLTSGLRDPKHTTIIDARSHPESRWPAWNEGELTAWVPRHFGAYAWSGGLGGWRSAHRYGVGGLRQDYLASVDVDVAAYAGRFPQGLVARHLPGYGNPAVTAWTVKGFWDYQFFMMTEEFMRAADLLVAEFGGQDRPDAAFFCCETLWWKCHRSMIADYLYAKHRQVVRHVPGSTLHSKVAPNRLYRYHQDVLTAWQLPAWYEAA